VGKKPVVGDGRNRNRRLLALACALVGGQAGAVFAQEEAGRGQTAEVLSAGNRLKKIEGYRYEAVSESETSEVELARFGGRKVLQGVVLNWRGEDLMRWGEMSIARKGERVAVATTGIWKPLRVWEGAERDLLKLRAARRLASRKRPHEEVADLESRVRDLRPPEVRRIGEEEWKGFRGTLTSEAAGAILAEPLGEAAGTLRVEIREAEGTAQVWVDENGILREMELSSAGVIAWNVGGEERRFRLRAIRRTRITGVEAPEALPPDAAEILRAESEGDDK